MFTSRGPTDKRTYASVPSRTASAVVPCCPFATRNVPKLKALLLFLACLPLSLAAQTWQQQGTLPRVPLAVDVDDRALTVLTEANLYTSDDGGATWTQRLSAANAPFLDPAGADGGLAGFRTISAARSAVFGRTAFLAVEPASRQFSATDYTVYATADGGATLREVFRVTDAYGQTDFGYGVRYSDAGDGVFAAVFERNGGFDANSFSSSTVYLSTDGGLSFRRAGDSFRRYLAYAGRTSVPGRDRPALAFRSADGTGSVTLIAEDGTALPPLPGPGVETDAAYVDGDLVVQAAFDFPPDFSTAGNPVVTVYRSTDRGATYTASTQDYGQNIYGVRFLGDDLYVSAGGSSFAQRQWRSEGPAYATGAPVTAFRDDPALRLSADGRVITRGRAGRPEDSFAADVPEPPAFRVYDVTRGNNAYAALPSPPYSLAALPEHDGRHLSAERSNRGIYSTTDGVNFRFAFPTSNYADEREYFDAASAFASYSDPSLSVYLTDDGRTASNGRARGQFTDFPSTGYWSGGGDALYGEGLLQDPVNGFFTEFLTRTSDAGRTTDTLDREHYLWSRSRTIGDPVTGDFYALRGFGGAAGPLLLSVSRDEGRSWRLIEGAAVPEAPITDADPPYTRRIYPPYFAYGGRLFVFDGESLRYSLDGGRTFAKAATPFPLVGAQVYRLGDRIGVRTRDERYFSTGIEEWLPTPGVLPRGVQVDLELSIRLDPAEPAPFTPYEVTVTVANRGSVTATGVFASIPSCGAGCIPQGGRDPVGTLGTIPAGESRSRTYFYFRQDGEVQRPYAEVLSQVEPDVDSRPGNGSSGPMEDDEARYDPNVVLPVELVAQSATTDPGDCSVSVSWTVGTEDGTAFYLVEAAGENGAWTALDTVTATGAADYVASVGAGP